MTRLVVMLLLVLVSFLIPFFTAVVMMAKNMDASYATVCSVGMPVLISICCGVWSDRAWFHQK